MREETKDAIELLGRVPLLSGLSEEELSRVAQVAIPRSYPKGSRVFHEGDKSDACYIVRSGEVRVTREHSDGRAIALATLGPGEIVGELAMLDGEVRSASVETLSDVELLAVAARDMRGLLQRNPAMTAKLVVALTRRVRETNERVARQSFQTVPSRVAGVLSQLVAEESGEGSPRDGVTIRMNQADLAQLAGTSRESVSAFPRRARAGRRRPRRSRSRHRDRVGATQRLHLLAGGPRAGRCGRRPRCDGRAAAARPWDRRPAGARGDGRGAARALRPRIRSRPGLRRPGAVDRLRADDLAALDRRRDLPGARARGHGERARDRHRQRLLGRRAQPPRRPGRLDRADRASSPIAPARGSPRPASGRSRSGSATAASAPRTRRRSRRSPSTPRSPRRRGRCSPSSPPAGRLSPRSPRKGEEILTRFRSSGRRSPGQDPTYSREPLASCRFVPLIGAEGYPDR